MQFRQRPRDSAVERIAHAEGYSALQARILAGRLSGENRSVAGLVRPRVSDMDTPNSLPDIDVAARHIADAVQNGAPIAIVTDHDADGATSHAIIRTCLRRWGVGPDRAKGYISHRMTEGYGVSETFVDRMLPDLEPGTCVITADQGSTDEARIARLRQAGHSVIVTDHHGVPDEGPPPSAHAVVNPVRVDSQFPDRGIAGCHTALLVMAAVRDELVRRGVVAPSSERVSELLDYCAVGTIADAATLGKSRNNRAIVQRGLQLMNSRPRPCWEALRRVLRKEGPWVASDIAFQVATRINARGRLGDAMLSVEFLCCEDVEVACEMAVELDSNNSERRRIERESTSNGLELARRAVYEGRYGLCLWLGDKGHSGVHGISASRIVESFGRPTICLSPVAGEAEFATGSIRSTPMVHVRDTINKIQKRWPELLLGGGGHAGAGGLRLRRRDMEVLEEAWDQCVRECYDRVVPQPEMLVDGDLEAPDLAHVAEMAALEPFGRGFESPVFFGEWLLKEVRIIGDGTHLKLVLGRNGLQYDAIWFGAKVAEAPVPVQAGQRLKLAYGIDANTYRGRVRLQLLVRGVEGDAQ